MPRTLKPRRYAGGTYPRIQTRCFSCGARVTWAVTRNGKKMPVDADPTPRGNLRLSPGIEQPTVEVVKLPAEGPLYISHHATCPDAKKWRRNDGTHEDLPR